ncbi:hypothetical protein SK128_021427, partial [Halocaridina rubra]
MVILFTQHEGERIEPQPTDGIVQEHLKGGEKENLHRSPNNLKGPGSPSSSAASPGTSPPTIKVEDLSIGVISEKHVVTLKQVSELIGRNKESGYTSPSVSPSTSSFSGSPSPPPSTSANITKEVS